MKIIKKINNTSNTNEKKGNWVFCKQYVNRWGKLMVAAEYGYQFWRFPAKGK